MKWLYPYQDPTREGFPPAPIWSPDSKWISVLTMSTESTIDLRLINIEGFEEYSLGNYDIIAWNAESSMIVLYPYSDDQNGVWISLIDDWNPIMMNLPIHSGVIDWIDPNIIEEWVELEIEIID